MESNTTSLQYMVISEAVVYAAVDLVYIQVVLDPKRLPWGP